MEKNGERWNKKLEWQLRSIVTSQWIADLRMHDVCARRYKIWLWRDVRQRNSSKEIVTSQRNFILRDRHCMWWRKMEKDGPKKKSFFFARTKKKLITRYGSIGEKRSAKLKSSITARGDWWWGNYPLSRDWHLTNPIARFLVCGI